MNDQESHSGPEAGFEQLPAPVYHVTSDRDSTVLVAMNVQIVNNKSFSWFDTVKERRMEGDIIEKTPERFSFRRSPQGGGQTYSFVPMTLEIYNSQVKNNLLGSKDFDDEQMMIDAFRQSLKNAW